MHSFSQQLESQGFARVDEVFTLTEIQAIVAAIDCHAGSSPNFRSSGDLFAIRCFLKEIPSLQPLLFNDRLTELLAQVQPGSKLVKSIYFNKPSRANWIVNWHQDLTINVRQKVESDGFANWTTKEGYFAVHPPISYLHHTVTLRIHLDNCDASNGALRVIPGSHTAVRHIQEIAADFFAQEVICEVPQGGVMLMKPLLWHSSRRTENNRSRRVIHLELCSQDLPTPLSWHENG